MHIELLHAVESIVVALLDMIPGCIEQLEPRHQSLIVMRALPRSKFSRIKSGAVLPMILATVANFTPREDVFIVPGIDRLRALLVGRAGSKSNSGDRLFLASDHD